MRRVVLVLALLACNGGPAGEGLTESWSHAVAQPDCAPWDGAATSVYLTSAPMDSVTPTPIPYLRLSVYHQLDGVRGRRWPLGGEGPDAALAFYCGVGSECTTARSGWIEFTPGDTGPLGGRYDVTFPDGSRRTGQFSAPIRELLMLCG
jgi:hypothetical protein